MKIHLVAVLNHYVYFFFINRCEECRYHFYATVLENTNRQEDRLIKEEADILLMLND